MINETQTNSEKKKSFICAIISWVSSLPARSVKIVKGVPSYEYMFTIEIYPYNKKASSIRIGVSKYDNTFDIALGQMIEFNELTLSENLFLEICAAVQQGRVNEMVWKLKGRIIRSKGELKLVSRSLFSDRGDLLSLLVPIFGLKETQLINYEPW